MWCTVNASRLSFLKWCYQREGKAGVPENLLYHFAWLLKQFSRAVCKAIQGQAEVDG